MNNNMTTDNMSNEEVIEVLKGIVFGGFSRTTPKERQALDLAIKALERPQGEWIEHNTENLLWGHNECPFCHKRSNRGAYYCQYCGADLKGGDSR